MDKIPRIAVLKLIGTWPNHRRDDHAAGARLRGDWLRGRQSPPPFSSPLFPKYVLLTPMDSVTGFAVLVICVLASIVAIRMALKVDPAEAIGG